MYTPFLGKNPFVFNLSQIFAASIIVRSSSTSSGCLFRSELSCFNCQHCLEGNIQDCENRDYIEDAQKQFMIQEDKDTTQVELVHEQSCLKSLAAPGQIVALYTDDANAIY